MKVILQALDGTVTEHQVNPSTRDTLVVRSDGHPAFDMTFVGKKEIRIVMRAPLLLLNEETKRWIAENQPPEER